MQRTNVFNNEFSPTGVETGQCFRHFYYRKILGLSPRTTNIPFVYGAAIHAGVEKFYGLHNHGISLPDIQKEVVGEFVKNWNKTRCLGDVKRSVEGGILTLNNYCTRYYHDSGSYQLEDIESEQWLPMPNGSSLLVKMDRVLNQQGQIILADTKTTSMPITDFYFRMFENHLPTTLYMYVVTSLFGYCDSIQIDAIKVPFPSQRSKTEAFGRASFMRTDLQMQDALASYCATTDYIMAALAKPKETWPARFYCNHAECSKKWGMCPFLDVCKHGLDHPTVQVNFDRVEVKQGEL